MYSPSSAKVKCACCVATRFVDLLTSPALRPPLISGRSRGHTLERFHYHVQQALPLRLSAFLFVNLYKLMRNCGCILMQHQTLQAAGRMHSECTVNKARDGRLKPTLQLCASSKSPHSNAVSGVLKSRTAPPTPKTRGPQWILRLQRASFSFIEASSLIVD